MSPELRSEYLSRVPSLLERARDGYELVTDGADRHGSLEWVFHRRDEELDRYVQFAATPLTPDADDTSRWLLELWAGAETGDRYQRVLVRSQRGTLVRIFDKFLATWTANAFDTAETLSTTGLSRSHETPTRRDEES